MYEEGIDTLPEELSYLKPSTIKKYDDTIYIKKAIIESLMLLANSDELLQKMKEVNLKILLELF